MKMLRLFIFTLGIIPATVTYEPCSSESSFQCSEDHCVNLTDVCDGQEQCPYGNDERYCGGCPSNWHYWRDHLYFIESEEKIFDEAEDDCHKLGGTLTSILDPEEKRFLLYLMVEGVNYWIGLTDRNEEGVFKWSDGSEVNYTDWRAGQPNDTPPGEDCGEILAGGGKWNDLRCIFKITYICKKPVTGGIEEIQLLLYGETDAVQASIHGGCSSPMGMSNNQILDDQISASSSLDVEHLPQYGRLLNTSYWMPKPDDTSPWIQVNFGQQMVISGLVIDGHLSLDLGWIWVDSFYVRYSHNGMTWIPYVYYTDNDKCGQLFCQDVIENGEEITMFTSRHACRRSLLLYHQLKASYLRIYPVIASKSHDERLKVGCKLEVIGCEDNDCDYSLGVSAGGITDVVLTSSSSLDASHVAATAILRIIPDVGAQGTGWIPAAEDSNPWFRIQMDAAYTVRAVVTKGCGDQLAWVTKNCVSYSNDGIFYRGSSIDNCQNLIANTDSTTLVRNKVDPEILTDMIMVHPIAWVSQPCMCVELIGCAAETKRCEMDHVASCDFTRICTHHKGQIASLDYPVPYPQRTACTWNIITDPGVYILLSFIEFDIPSLGDCSSSSVALYDGDIVIDDAAIGVYCNYRRPPKTLISAFNHIFVVHTSGAEESGTGFIAEYSQSVREPYFDVPTLPGPTMCPYNWTNFHGNCYGLVNSEEYINWITAEERCNEAGAHLVSIRNEDDMEFIHSLIINSLERYVNLPLRTYIGLHIKHNEWVHRWVDGRPLSYTDWITPMSSEGWISRQPDGGRLESCVLIDLANVHSTNHWHDVPCVSDNEANQYICMTSQQGGNITTILAEQNLNDNAQCPDHMTTCRNDRCIHKIYACDATSGCLSQEQCQKELGPVHGTSQMIRGRCKQGEFECLRISECISISFVCDYTRDCEDHSDEELCVYPVCRVDEFACSNGQCISSAARCDLLGDCVANSDEDMCDHVKDSFQCYDGTWLPAHAQCDGQRDCSGKNWEDESHECGIYQRNFTCTSNRKLCKNGACADRHYDCLFEQDIHGFLQGCRDATNLENCANTTCGSGQIKCPGSYCIPLRYRCNGRWECPNGEDEHDCDLFQCPNHYRCKGHSNCLDESEICDGVQHCPGGDDEWFCAISCPEGCVCFGLYFSCVDVHWNAHMASMIPWDVRELNMVNLIGLSTVSDDVTTIQRRLHIDLARMEFIILLNLFGNGIGEIDSTTFFTNMNLQILSLANNSITHIWNATFVNLRILKYLDLSRNPLIVIETGGFLNLNFLTFLSIEETTLKDGTSKMFTDLIALESLHSDKYLFCCLVTDIETLTECLPEPDQFSSCEDLIRIPALRIFMWILGISALLGNSYVILKRVLPGRNTLLKRRGETARVQNIMIGNLAGADSLMGVYMMIIAAADVYYRDQYAHFAEEWQTSILCKMAGLLSVLSSEASVLFMTVLSIDRFFACVFPFSGVKLYAKSAGVTALVVWVVSFFISILPVMIPLYFGNAFYGRSTVCLALPLTNGRPEGWEYSIALFLGVNLLAFLIMLCCYGSIYFTVRSSSTTLGRGSNEVRSKEIQLALRMAFLVFSDMCCWMPIIIMGIMSSTGIVNIPPISYAWIAVFVLPLNSSLNPYLYTILTRELTKRQNTKKSRDTVHTLSTNITLHNVEGHGNNGGHYVIDTIQSLNNDMAEHNILLSIPSTLAGDDFHLYSDEVHSNGLTPSDHTGIAQDLYTALTYLHEHHIVCTEDSIDKDHIIIRKRGNDIRAFLLVSSLRTTNSTNNQDYECNRVQLARILKKMAK